MNRIETTILSNLFFREDYTRKVLPFIKKDYFNTRTEQLLFEEVYKFIDKYNNLPTKETILIELNTRKDINEEEHTAIKEYVVGGGFLFAMCSATDSYDIALAAEGIDICAQVYDNDPLDPRAQEKLDFSKCMAFQNFTLEKNPYIYEYSDIDATRTRKLRENEDYFSLFEFSAKWDPIPTMLTQNHTRIIKCKGSKNPNICSIEPINQLGGSHLLVPV